MNMKIVLVLTWVVLAPLNLIAQPSPHDLHFDQLATHWDEAIPLGNGTVGALLWRKEDHLRFSLDRSDIWDLRPMKGLDRKEFRFEWIQEHVRNNDYKIVQDYFDSPYDKEPAPSKIPAGALEFNLPYAKVVSVHLSVEHAVCEVRWENGVILKSFVHATLPVGWFRFENIPSTIIPQIVPPEYEGQLTGGEVNSLLGDDLARLGYKQGKIQQDGNRITYLQEGWGGFTYEITVEWSRPNSTTLEGVWSISSHYPEKAISHHAS